MRSRLVALVLLVAVAAVALLAIARAPSDSRAGEELGPVFEVGELSPGFGYITSFALGPDGRLYVGSLFGITALTLDESGTKVVVSEGLPALNYVLGMAFDPEAEVPTLYASTNNQYEGDGGRIVRLTAPEWKVEEVITGLPNSPLLELTNGLVFDAGGRLLVANGGYFGAPILSLAGAILVADVRSPELDGHVTYDNLTGEQTGGDVYVFAPGMKNPYGLIVHSNGRIYATDNGGLGPDELNLIEKGSYYGHPNSTRALSDPRQGILHPGYEPGNDEYTAPMLAYENACTLCGLSEYTSDAFDGAMQGDLVTAALGGDINWIQLSDDGTSVEGRRLLANLRPGIAVIAAPNGAIYAGGNSPLYYMKPAGLGPATPTLTPTSTWTPTFTLGPPTPTNTPPPTPPPLLPGDANCDRVIDSRDAALVLQAVARLLLEPPCGNDADFDRNGYIESIDALLILQCSAGFREC